MVFMFLLRVEMGEIFICDYFFMLFELKVDEKFEINQIQILI